MVTCTVPSSMGASRHRGATRRQAVGHDRPWPLAPCPPPKGRSSTAPTGHGKPRLTTTTSSAPPAEAMSPHSACCRVGDFAGGRSSANNQGECGGRWCVGGLWEMDGLVVRLGRRFTPCSRCWRNWSRHSTVRTQRQELLWIRCLIQEASAIRSNYPSKAQRAPGQL